MQNISYTFKNISISIELGSDSLYGIRATDNLTGATWWITICETLEDAKKTVMSQLETEAILSLQKQLDHVNLTK